MDFAYDQITARSYASGSDRSGANTPKPSDGIRESTTDSSTNTPTPSSPQRQTLQSELQDTLRVFSATPWGTKLGGWWSSAKTQSVSYYETARSEAVKREQEAAKALEAARKAVVQQAQGVVGAVEDGLDRVVNEERRAEEEARQKAEEAEAQERDQDESSAAPTEQETDTLIARFKSTALMSLAEVQKAEDAADEALWRFGNNIRNFLRDTISITAPEDSSTTSHGNVMFETTAPISGKRVIHTSRLDAQLHVIHTTPSSFEADPSDSGDEWNKWKTSFKIEQQTEQIAQDLEQFPDLRGTMEALAEKVSYADFWTRYYFLRHIVEEREARRKDLLKASTVQSAEEEIAWDNDDSESEAAASPERARKTPRITTSSPPAATTIPVETATQTQTQIPARPSGTGDAETVTLRAGNSRRRSHDEKSVADSEASYDLVSGAASHAASSPKEKALKEESDEDDWE